MFANKGPFVVKGWYEHLFKHQRERQRYHKYVTTDHFEGRSRNIEAKCKYDYSQEEIKESLPVQENLDKDTQQTPDSFEEEAIRQRTSGGTQPLEKCDQPNVSKTSSETASSSLTDQQSLHDISSVTKQVSEDDPQDLHSEEEDKKKKKKRIYKKKKKKEEPTEEEKPTSVDKKKKKNKKKKEEPTEEEEKEEEPIEEEKELQKIRNSVVPLSEFYQNSGDCHLPEYVSFIQEGKEAYLDLKKGKMFFLETNKPISNVYINTPALFTGTEQARYYLQMLLLDRPFRRPSPHYVPAWKDDLTAWSCAAAIRLNRGTQKAGQSIFKTPKVLRDSAAFILHAFWKNLPDRSGKLRVFSDNVRDATFYYYSDNKFVRIPDVGVRKFVNEFITYIYNEDIPKAANTEICKNEFIHYLITNNPVTSFVKDSGTPDGLGFKNCFAAITPGADHVQKKPYSSDLFVTSSVNVPYRDADIKIDPLRSNKNFLVVGDDFFSFLLKLCRGNPTLGFIIKGLIRGIVTAGTEGHLFQTFVYLYGPPSSGKSELIKLIERFCDADKVQHLSRHYNRFTNKLFLGSCRLLVIDDVQRLLYQDIELLKPLLGRDALAVEEKYKNDTKNVRPICQVIMVSNHPPEHFSVLNDPGILSKIIAIELEPTDQLREEDRIPDFHKTCDRYMSELFNWAVYGREEDLVHHVRGEYYQKQRETNRALKSDGIHAFICEQLMYREDSDQCEVFISFEDVFTLLQDFAISTQSEDLKQFTENTPTNKKRARTAGQICREISYLLKMCYQKTCPVKRYTKLHSTYGATRPNGILNITQLTLNRAGTEILEGYEELKPVPLEDKREIGDLLLCSPTIVRFSDINTRRLPKAKNRRDDENLAKVSLTSPLRF